MKANSDESRKVLQELAVDLNEDVIPDTLNSGNVRTLIDAQKRLRMLCTLAWHVFESTSVDEILQAALRAVERLTQAERCFVVALAPDESLSVRASHPSAKPADSAEWSISNTIVRRVLSDGRALLSSDAMTEFASVPSVQLHRIRSVMCVPLGNSPSQSVAIYADSRADKAVFTELDLRFLVALGHFVFLSMRNALAQEDIKKKCQLSDERWKSLQDQLLEHRIVGSSQAMLKSYDRLRQVASTDRALLLLGPTGVGKDLFAKAAHRLSARSNKPFVRVDVATLSEDLIESELFGHVKGAFTNAIRDKKGRFELANGGTLFLDEIGNIPMPFGSVGLRSKWHPRSPKFFGGNKLSEGMRAGSSFQLFQIVLIFPMSIRDSLTQL